MKIIITVLIFVLSINLYSQEVDLDIRNRWICTLEIYDLIDISDDFNPHPILKLKTDKDIEFICEYIQRIKPIILSEEESRLILRFGVPRMIKITEITEIIKFTKKCTNKVRSDFGELKIIITYSSESDDWLTLPTPPPKTRIE